MVEVTSIDLRNQPYDAVNQYMHNLAGIPDTQEWDKIKEKRALRGLIPTTKMYDMKFFSIVENNHKAYNSSPGSSSHSKYFRTTDFMGYYFITGKNFYTYANKTKRIFIINVYEECEQTKNIELLKQLADIFVAQQIRIFSVQKDHHDGHRGRDEPFRRNIVALMVVDV
jgi:hypothetical protein